MNELNIQNPNMAAFVAEYNQRQIELDRMLAGLIATQDMLRPPAPVVHHHPTRLYSNNRLFSCWIEINGRPAEVYSPTTEGRTMKGYIASTEGARFVVHSEFPGRSRKASHPNYAAYITIDGESCGGALGVSRTEMTTASCHGFTSGGMIQPFLFAKPNLLENATVLPKEQAEKLSTITIDIVRVIHGEMMPEGSRWATPGLSDTISERNKKAHVAALTSFGQSVPCQNNMRAVTRCPRDDESPYFTFTVTYMPLDVLQAFGYAPRLHPLPQPGLFGAPNVKREVDPPRVNYEPIVIDDDDDEMVEHAPPESVADSSDEEEEEDAEGDGEEDIALAINIPADIWNTGPGRAWEEEGSQSGQDNEDDDEVIEQEQVAGVEFDNLERSESPEFGQGLGVEDQYEDGEGYDEIQDGEAAGAVMNGVWDELMMEGEHPGYWGGEGEEEEEEEEELMEEDFEGEEEDFNDEMESEEEEDTAMGGMEGQALVEGHHPAGDLPLAVDAPPLQQAEPDVVPANNMPLGDEYDSEEDEVDLDKQFLELKQRMERLEEKMLKRRRNDEGEDQAAAKRKRPS